MVREMEGPAAEPVTLEIRLPADDDAAERMAERAMATLVALVDRGASVLLATTEDGGPKMGAVGDRRGRGPSPGPRRRRTRRWTRRRTRRWTRRRTRWAGGAAVSVLEAVKRANRPGPPEHSITLARGVRRRGGHRHRRLPGRGRAVVGGRGRLDRPRDAWA